MFAQSIFSRGHVCKYSKLPFLSDFAAVFMKNSAVFMKNICAQMFVYTYITNAVRIHTNMARIVRLRIWYMRT